MLFNLTVNTQKHTAPISVATYSPSASKVEKPSEKGATIYRGYKFRIYPNKKQRERIDADINACRFVYNLALETKIYAYRSLGVSLSAYDLQKQITELKRDHDWIRSASGQSLEQSMVELHSAFAKFFAGSGYPKFKSKRDKNSATYRESSGIRKGKLNITKCHGIKVVISKPLRGETKSVIITRTPTGKYFASFLQKEDSPQRKPINGSIGIDLGLTHFATLSDGTKIENPRHLKDSLKRIQCLQRRVSRKRKGSANRKKAIYRLALAHERVTNQRQDFLHNLSTKIVRDSQAGIICVEDLATSNMMKNHKLAQAISDVSWSEFVRQLQYKCDWTGKRLIKVDRFFPSSKMCNVCGSLTELDLSIRQWTCKCGSSHDRDVNAAINIQKEGLIILSGKDISVGSVESRRLRRTKKQKNEN